MKLKCENCPNIEIIETDDIFIKVHTWKCLITKKIISKYVKVLHEPDIPDWCPELKRQGWERIKK